MDLMDFFSVLVPGELQGFKTAMNLTDLMDLTDLTDFFFVLGPGGG